MPVVATYVIIPGISLIVVSILKEACALDDVWLPLKLHFHVSREETRNGTFMELNAPGPPREFFLSRFWGSSIRLIVNTMFAVCAG